MNSLFFIVIHTANILGSFNDPFEFDGDYGAQLNPIREKVFELLVSKESLAKGLSKEQLIEAIEKDRLHGPTLADLVNDELIFELMNKQQQLQDYGFSRSELEGFLTFIDRYAEQKIFRFFRNNPSKLLSIDKNLRDKASLEGKPLELSIVSSTYPLEGKNSFELKRNLLDQLFRAELFALTEPQEVIKTTIQALDKNFLQQFFGENADTEDLLIFSSPAGQLLFYWLYQALQLHLVAEEQSLPLIEEINRVKEIFFKTLGDSKTRAATFREKILAAQSGVLFTQESDKFIAQELVSDGLFLPIDRQNPQDGCFVFLRSDLWEPDYEVLAIDGYEGYNKGKLNVILATYKQTGQRFLLASTHGNSIQAEDGRLQISLIMEKFYQLSQEFPENSGLQLLIGTDANTKTPEEVQKLRDHLDSLGLMATSVGPTTIKKRMVTVQHSKAGKLALDEEDYLITLKPQFGSSFSLMNPTVNFIESQPKYSNPLPNLDNQSDHYPVGATFICREIQAKGPV